MTIDGEDRNGADNDLPKLSSISTKGLFSSLREKSGDVLSTPEGSSKGKSSGFFSSPKNNCKSPVPTSPAVLSLNVHPLKNNLTKLLTPSRTFSRLRDERDEVSRLTPTPCTSSCFKDRIKLPLVGEVRFDHVAAACKTWLKNPKNLALLFWGLAVGVSGALLFMVMVGMLDAAIPSRSERDTLFEVSNQILNALFTLMCVYLHPQRCFHLHMLIRWKPADILKLREVYCKNGTRKPHEWAHMCVVVSLLQLNCWAQYALCGLNWGYRRPDRPAIGVGLCLCLSMGGAAGAGIYNILSPLGKDFEVESDGSAEDVEKGSLDSHHRQYQARAKIYRMLERRVSFADREEGSMVANPEWRGGVFDCAQDKPIAMLSTVCCPCVFGWNMDRLGFGNRYVHIVTFVLLCTAPFWIFDLAAINIQNRVVRHSIGAAGIVLCAFGLLYGGFWRIRMRERFKLPGNSCCCGHYNVADCAQWMFCPLCSLCQEVRTAEYYEVRDDKFYSRGYREAASPLPTSPPNEDSLSFNTPATTIPAVKEMPPTGAKTDGTEIELISSTNPFAQTGEISNGHSPISTNPFLTPEVLAAFNPLAPPTSVTASRESSHSGHGSAHAGNGLDGSITSRGEAVHERLDFGARSNESSVHLERNSSNESSSHKHQSVTSRTPPLHAEDAPSFDSPTVTNDMFQHTEEGAYDCPEITSKLKTSFLPADEGYHHESPRIVSTVGDDDLKHLSPSNPFLERKVIPNGNSSLSSSQLPADEIHRGSPGFVNVDDNELKNLSPNNPFLEPKVVVNGKSPLSMKPELISVGPYAQTDEAYQGSINVAAVHSSGMMHISPSNPFLDPKIIPPGNSPLSSSGERLMSPAASSADEEYSSSAMSSGKIS